MISLVYPRGTLERAAARAMKWVAAGYDLASPHRRGIVVLAYHRIGRRSSLRVDLPEWLFDEQMERLAEGAGVIDLDSALAALAQDAPVGPDPAVVTFDDGTADFVEVALPILVRHRVPATVYVATRFVDEGRSFPHEGPPVSWAALADAVSTGFVTVGSHTHSHALLDRLPASVVGEELDRSVDLIGERLGVTARHFAYPKALPGSHAAEAAVRRRFVSAALAGTRPNPYRTTDAYRLARSPLQVEDGLTFFTRKVSGGMRVEDSVRQLANRFRLGLVRE